MDHSAGGLEQQLDAVCEATQGLVWRERELRGQGLAGRGGGAQAPYPSILQGRPLRGPYGATRAAVWKDPLVEVLGLEIERPGFKPIKLQVRCFHWASSPHGYGSFDCTHERV